MYILSSPSARACTNCGTCVSKCTKNAIVLNNNGKYYINTNCDNCGDCKSACTIGSIVNNKIACWQDIIDLGATYPATVTSQSLQQYCPTKTEIISGSDIEISYPETYNADQLVMLGDLSAALNYYISITVLGSYNSGNGAIDVTYYTDYTGGWGVGGVDIDDPDAQYSSTTYQYIKAPITISEYYITIQLRYLTYGASTITVATKTIKIDDSILYNNTSGSIPYHRSAAFYVADKIQSILGNLRIKKITDAYGNEITNVYNLPKLSDSSYSYKFKRILTNYNVYGAAWEYYSIQYITTYCVQKSVSSSYRKLGNMFLRVRSFPDGDTASLEDMTGISITTGSFSSNRVSNKSSTLYPRIGVGHKQSNYSTWFAIDASATYKGKLQIYVSLTRLTTVSAVKTFIQTYSPVAEFDYSNPGTVYTSDYYYASTAGFSSAWQGDFYGYDVWKTLNAQGAFENATNIPKVQLLLVYS